MTSCTIQTSCSKVHTHNACESFFNTFVNIAQQTRFINTFLTKHNSLHFFARSFPRLPPIWSTPSNKVIKALCAVILCTNLVTHTKQNTNRTVKKNKNCPCYLGILSPPAHCLCTHQKASTFPSIHQSCVTWVEEEAWPACGLANDRHGGRRWKGDHFAKITWIPYRV